MIIHVLKPENEINVFDTRKMKGRKGKERRGVGKW